MKQPVFCICLKQNPAFCIFCRISHILSKSFNAVANGGMEQVMKTKNILPPTSKKVFLRTDPKTNMDIRNQTLKHLEIFKGEPGLSDRIGQLSQEWDTERVMEVHASLLILLSSYLGIKTSRFWFLLTGVVSIFMLQHALQGWCPTLPFIRKWGIRTSEEIYAEKTALKIIRGDFTGEIPNPEDALNRAEKQ